MNYLRSLVGLLVLSCCVSAMPVQGAATTTAVFIGTSVNGQTTPNGYYEFLPASYNANSLTNYPVVIFYHGLGEGGVGTNPGSPPLSNVTAHGPAYMITHNQYSTFDTNNVIVLCPQTGNNVWWNENSTRNFLNFAVKAYPKIDPRRIWMTGLSSGSQGTTSFMNYDSNPSQVAAFMVCAYRGDSFTTQASNLAKVSPFWILTSLGDFSGGPDAAVTAQATAILGRTTPFTNVMLNYPGGNTPTQVYTAHLTPTPTPAWTWVQDVDPISGVNPKLTVFTGSDHNSWDRTYNNANTWTWLYQQQKPDVTFSSPSTGTTTNGGAVTFTGSGTDKDSNAITGTSLIWSSNINGVLGTGASLTTSGLSVGSHTITLQAIDSGYRGNKATINLIVPSGGAGGVQPAITNGPPPATATVAVPYSFSYASTGPPAPTFSVTSGTLPPGITLSSLGVLSGTPTTAGTYSNIVITAGNGTGTPVTRTISIVVSPPPSSIGIDCGNTTAIPYTSATDNLTYTVDGNFTGSNGVSTTTQAIAGTTDSLLYQTVRYGAGFTYAVAVPNGTYSVTLKFAEIAPYVAAGARKFNVSIQGVQVLSNFEILANAARFAALDRTFTATVANGTLTMVFTRTGDEYVYLSAILIKPAPVQPTITNGPPSSSGTVGTPYTTFTYTYTGTPAPTFSATGLPPGLTLSTSGVLSGTPTTAGDYNPVVTATNGAGTNPTQTFLISIQDSGSDLQTFRTTAGLASDGSQDTLTPGKDGVSNIMKFAFNMTSNNYADLGTFNHQVLTSNGTSGLPLVQTDGSNHLTITFVRRKNGTAGITYIPQATSTLGSGWSTMTNATTITSIDSTWERVTYTDTETFSSAAKRFVRVNVTSP